MYDESDETVLELTNNVVDSALSTLEQSPKFGLYILVDKLKFQYFVYGESQRPCTRLLYIDRWEGNWGW